MLEGHERLFEGQKRSLEGHERLLEGYERSLTDREVRAHKQHRSCHELAELRL
jgi:hypothetical protein